MRNKSVSQLKLGGAMAADATKDRWANSELSNLALTIFLVLTSSASFLGALRA